ncbi:MAG: hypothetical protein ACRBHB_08840 [Arenicella sp.]
MSNNIKYIHLLSIEKREAILIRSFLSLAKGEMNVEYMIDEGKSHRADLYIVDEIAHHDEINRGNEQAEILVVGADLKNKEPWYLHRPLQWSRFKSSLDRVNQTTVGTVAYDLSMEKTAVVEIEGADEDQDGVKSFRADTDYILDNSTLQTEETITAEAEASSSVRQTEEPFDMLEDQIKSDSEEVKPKSSVSNKPVANSQPAAEPLPEEIDIQPFDNVDRLGKTIEFWENEDCQVIVKDTPVLFIKARKEMVYSEYPYFDWEILLRSRDARKAKLPDNWEPTGRMKSYSLSWLVWFSSHARSKGYLVDELDKEHFFLLDKWPEFDLLYNNNEHLKLCGLMFKEGQSIQEMVSRTRLRARVIIALINACYKMGILSSFPDKDSAKPKVSQEPIDTHTVMSLLSKVFKT